MGQCGELDRNTLRGELGIDETAPASGTFESAAKAVLQTLLVANSAGRCRKRLVRHIVRPQRQYPTLFRAESISLSGRKCPQYRANFLAPLVDASVAFPS